MPERGSLKNDLGDLHARLLSLIHLCDLHPLQWCWLDLPELVVPPRRRAGMGDRLVGDCVSNEGVSKHRVYMAAVDNDGLRARSLRRQPHLHTICLSDLGECTTVPLNRDQETIGDRTLSHRSTLPADHGLRAEAKRPLELSLCQTIRLADRLDPFRRKQVLMDT